MVFGIIIVANGQLLSCIRSVEENTRATALLLDRLSLENGLAPSEAPVSSSRTEDENERGLLKGWICRCGAKNAPDDELCGSCGRSPNAIV